MEAAVDAVQDERWANCAAFFEGFWNAAPMSMFSVYPLDNGDFAVEAINPATEAAWGQTTEEVAHRPLAEILPPAYLESVQERYRQCLTSGEPLSYEEECSPDPYRPRWWSTLLVPVRDEEGKPARLYGVAREVTEVYEVYAELSRAKAEYTRTNADLERRVAERTQELEAAKERLERLARVDELTETWNRRYLFEIAPALADQCRRDGRPLGALMMDADHFKTLNDRHGHQAGDEALRRIADAVRANLRTVDTVGRYGGEELLALLPGADLSATERVAERVRSAVAAEPGFPALSISVGTAAVDPAVEDLEELIRRADDSLLRAKHSGRNQVVTAPPALAPASPIC